MQSIRLKYLGQEIEPELPTQEPGERSVEEIAAAWRDSDLKDDAAVDFGDDGIPCLMRRMSFCRKPETTVSASLTPISATNPLKTNFKESW